MNKFEKTQQLLHKTKANVIATEENWRNFLNTSAKMYKHEFNTQLLIHAHRPDFTACTTFEKWTSKNDGMNRHIIKNSEGVPFINEKNKLEYLFDITQTDMRKNEKSINPWIWSINDNHIDAFNKRLDEKFNTNGATLKEKLIDLVVSKVTANYQKYSQDLKNVDDSHFHEFLTSSVCYSVLQRCGIEDKSDIEHFRYISDFKDELAYKKLSSAFTDISNEILVDIEENIKVIEKEVRKNLINERMNFYGKNGERENNRWSQTRTQRGGTEVLSRHENNKQHNLRSGRETGQISLLSSGVSNSDTRGDNSGDERRNSTGSNGIRGRGQQENSRGQVDDNRDRPASTRGTEPIRESGRKVLDEEKGLSREPGRGDGIGDNQSIWGHERKISEGEQNRNVRADENGQQSEQSSARNSEKSTESNRQDSNRDENKGQGVHPGSGQERLYDDATSREQLHNDSRGNSISTDNLLIDNVTVEDNLLSPTVSLYNQEEQLSLFNNVDKEEKTVIFSIKQNDYEEYFQNDNISLEELLEIYSKADVKFQEVTKQGSSINEATFASLTQTADDLLSINIDVDSNNLIIFKDNYENGETKTYFLDKAIEIINSVGKEEFKNHLYKADVDFIEEKTINENPQNFIIKNDKLGDGGAKTKYKANIEAIKTLKHIEKEKRLATPEEQEILSNYVGWGGLAQAFDANIENWSKEYSELIELLTPLEYESARASTLNAHYTSPTVVKAIYKAVENMGFEKGNILEPSMGVGNFFGLLPEKMKESSLYGVELDSLTGRIAKQLYQKANIQVKGFEKTSFPDNFFDLAIGNIPFGGIKVSDKQYNKHNFFIHDYFCAKSLDKVRPGGVVAFVTSKGTLDKANPKIRKYLAQRAELVGAIRLPNNAFKDNAGTEVPSDILFLQKRDKILDIEPEWVFLNKNEDGLTINQYFIDNPHMILGKIVAGNSMYGYDENATTCIPIKGAILSEQLEEAIKNINATITERKNVDIKDIDGIVLDKFIPADPNVRNYSFTLVDDNIYYRKDSQMHLIDIPKSQQEILKELIKIRDSVRTLISLQLEDVSDKEIKKEQNNLNSLYDNFAKNHGRIFERKIQKIFKDDVSIPLLNSLEVIKENKFVSKADMFYKRTIKQRVEITSVETATEALAISISEKAKVDIDFMSKLTGKSENQLYEDLQGIIFKNPLHETDNIENKYFNADEYLSGNIREKLEIAKNKAEIDPQYNINVTALENAMPKRLEASEIDVRLGATWIEPHYIHQFINEVIQPRYSARNNISVNYSSYTAEWNIEGKSLDKNNIIANIKYGTSRKNAYQIIEDSLNLRDVKVYDRIEDADGKMVSVVNRNATIEAQNKQKEIKEVFKDWIFKDINRRKELVEKYNVLFNSIKPREYDGEHINFVGINPEITLRPHQKNAVAHTLYGGNTLLAHEVGAGKTFEMIASAMESKRLGLCNKSLFVVPNHLTEQMGNDFIKLYPSANILVAKKEDFIEKNRKNLYAKIATGDFDAVIIGHSQLMKIPVSEERQERMIRQQINEIIDGISELKSQNSENFHVKQLEKTKKNLETKLDKLLHSSKRDDVVTFEELGIDKMYLDEAHLFKNLFLNTKMRNVAGISTNDNVQKTVDLYMKCQYLDEITGGKGLVFATGTPVSNSMTEVYSMMKYLQNDLLQEKGLKHFDAWAATFGETVTAMELAPEGTGYRSKTRFSKFYNLPEMMNMFKECADIKTMDMLDDLVLPKCDVKNVVVKPTETQRELVGMLSERAKKIQNKEVEPSVDNMLKITTDGRKTGLDQRLINPLLPDEPGTKVNVCIDNVFRIWGDTKEDKLTQIVFCDFSTPKNDGTFNLYDDIKDKLISKGVPEEEIAFIHDATNEKQKEELFSKVRGGDIRVIIGSTSKMGAGTNIQDKLVASHDLDCPWKPSDMEQRRGRMVRQGNDNKNVQLFRYVTEGTFDAYLFQMLENKQKFISQIMTSKTPVRSCEDVDEAVLSYAEVKALCAGNPLIKEKMDLDIDVARLKIMKSHYQNNLFSLEDKLNVYPAEKKKIETAIENIKKDMDHLSKYPKLRDETGKIIFSPMNILGVTYTDKETAGKALLSACTKVAIGTSGKDREIGEYKGFKMNAYFDILNKNFILYLNNNFRYKIDLGSSISGNLTRIDNALENLTDEYEDTIKALSSLDEEMIKIKEEIDVPFKYENELQSKIERLNEVDFLINITDDSKSEEIQEEKKSEAKEYHYLQTTPEGVSELEKSDIKFDKKENELGFIIRYDKKDKEAIEDVLGQSKGLSK